VLKGLSLIRRHRPDLIWSTFPIATANLIGLTLHRLSGLPWVADFRDPMTDRDPVTGEEFPSDPAVRKVNGWIERPAIKRCARAVFTTAGTAEMYAQRFSGIDPSRWAVIPNGYDEESFRAAEMHSTPRAGGETKKIVLLHSGTLYSHARDPRAFFEALAALRAAGEISAATLSVVLRGSGHEALYQSYLKELGLEDVVRLEGTVRYDQALVEMLSADGLLVFQASNCNWQIPAKIYEYLRARRPILAFTDSNGDTAKLLRSEGIDTIVPIDSREDIVRGLQNFLRSIKQGTAPLATAAGIERHSRRLRTRELATLLDQLSDAPVALRAGEAAAAPQPLGAAGYTRKQT
jgi:glycosyltransferase involved in cell wall biosynthesis